MNSARAMLVISSTDEAAANGLGGTFAVVQAVEGPLVRLRGPGTEQAIASPVDDVLAWVALTPGGAAEVGRFASALQAATARPVPVIDLSAAPAGDRALALAQGKAEALETALAASRRLTVELARGLAGLRREHQSVLERYQAIEARTAAAALAGPPVCDIAAGGDPIEIGPGGPFGEKISMLLPFSISGLYRIDLSVLRAAPESRLRLSLESLEDGAELLHWSRPGETLGTGWTAFTLDTALNEPPASGRLWVQVEHGPVVLEAGAPHPLSDLRVEGELATAEGPLALRAWTSVPGLPATPIPQQPHG